MWAVLVRTIFSISCKEGLPGIWSKKFCGPFLIIPNALVTTGVIFVLSSHILVTSISRSLYFGTLSMRCFDQRVLPRLSWCKFVLHGFWLLYPVCFRLFFYPFEQWNQWLRCMFIPLLSVWYLIMFT